jgi:hypothetical protein
MTLPYSIASSQTDAKSPVDDNLMDSIRLNLEYLDQISTQGGAPVYVWNVNGELAMLPFGIAKRVDMQFLHVLQQFSTIRVAQGVSGDSGITEVDVRYHSNPKTPIVSIIPQLSQNTNTISQITPNLATQSIARATDPVATQTITRAKATLNITSIVKLTENRVRYNLDGAVDTNYQDGFSVLIAGCSNGVNNGTFTILERNQSGFNSIVITNAAGVNQASSAGTLELQVFSYNLVNPADSHFVAGETVVMASHTNGLSNGMKVIFKTNEGGNNVWVHDTTGVTQGGAAGSVTTGRMRYSYASPVSDDFVVGETVQLTGHTNPANNGNTPIVAKNVSGNNIIIINGIGTAQGAVAGNANTKRWKYTFSTNPASQITVGERARMSGHTNPLNNGVFTIVEINNLTSDNVVVHNPSGVAQGSAAGQVNHTKKLVSFLSDQSLIYSTDSYVELQGCVDANYEMSRLKLPYKVLQVNRGGGANYNIIIDEQDGGTQANPSGFVAIEARSIFNLADGSKPQVAADLVAKSATGLLKSVYTSSAFINSPIPAQTYLGLYVLRVQTGRPRDLSVMLT